MAYKKENTIIKFALTPSEMEWLEKYMEFYHCKSRGQYFKLKLKTDLILFEKEKKEK